MSNIEIFQNEEFGEIRTIEEEGKVLFCASDVAKALGYEKPNNAVATHCRATLKRGTPISGKMKAVFIISPLSIFSSSYSVASLMCCRCSFLSATSTCSHAVQHMSSSAG